MGFLGEFYEFFQKNFFKKYLQAIASVNYSYYKFSLCHGDRDVFPGEAATGGVLWKIVFLQVSRNSHLCQNLFFNKLAALRPKACNFIKKEALAQVFSC